jgi:hypothetical protein
MAAEDTRPLGPTFPGSEDYEEGADPVRDLTLLEQIEYWKTRAHLAEQTFWKIDELDAVLEDLDGADRDGADWWKEQ